MVIWLYPSCIARQKKKNIGYADARRRRASHHFFFFIILQFVLSFLKKPLVRFFLCICVYSFPEKVRPRLNYRKGLCASTAAQRPHHVRIYTGEFQLVAGGAVRVSRGFPGAYSIYQERVPFMPSFICFSVVFSPTLGALTFFFLFYTPYILGGEETLFHLRQME